MPRKKLTKEEKEWLSQEIEQILQEHGSATCVDAITERLEKQGYTKAAEFARKSRNEFLEISLLDFSD